MKRPPHPVVIKDLKDNIVPAEAQWQFQEKSAGHRSWRLRESSGDLWSISFAAGAEFLAFMESASHESANSESRFSFAVKKPAVEGDFAAENYGLQGRVETKKVIFARIRQSLGSDAGFLHQISFNG
jgi:hypothetical protein